MQIVQDAGLARTLAAASTPVLYTAFKRPLFERVTRGDGLTSVLGRRYRGAFGDSDGSYVTVTQTGNETVIDRDSYGSIPLFYATTGPIVTTDMRFLSEIARRDVDLEAVPEYLSAAYLTAGKSIYRGIRWLMPNETIVIADNKLSIKRKDIFPAGQFHDAREASELLEQALDRSIADLLGRFPGKVRLNLSGGADSTLLLAKMRVQDRAKDIATTTYFHADWRDDLDDWKYANEAAEKFGATHKLVTIDNRSFCKAHRDLLSRASNVFHTYAAAFYEQNRACDASDDDAPLINGSGPDESIIGTEKIPIADLMALRDVKPAAWIDRLISDIDYIKLPEGIAISMVCDGRAGFVASRRQIANDLVSAANFVEFQRRYHMATVLQDHIHELSAVAQTLNRPILFPYLTNDIFRIIFSTAFESLNTDGVYKSVVKEILEKFMPKSFVYRKKIGFQSPSRPYFMSDAGLGRELARLLAKGKSSILDLAAVEPAIRARLGEVLDRYRRYDFLEWTAYNILLLEELRSART